jgi:hypothetical protein
LARSSSAFDMGASTARKTVATTAAPAIISLVRSRQKTIPASSTAGQPGHALLPFLQFGPHLSISLSGELIPCAINEFPGHSKNQHVMPHRPRIMFNHYRLRRPSRSQPSQDAFRGNPLFSLTGEHTRHEEGPMRADGGAASRDAARQFQAEVATVPWRWRDEAGSKEVSVCVMGPEGTASRTRAEVPGRIAADRFRCRQGRFTGPCSSCRGNRRLSWSWRSCRPGAPWLRPRRAGSKPFSGSRSG